MNNTLIPRVSKVYFVSCWNFYSLYGETKTGKIESSSKRNYSVALVRRETRILFYL